MLHHEIAGTVFELTIEKKRAPCWDAKADSWPEPRAETADNQIRPGKIASVQNLDRHVPVHVGLLGFIDRSHAARSDLLDDAELTRDFFTQISVDHQKSLSDKAISPEETAGENGR